ncbi:MAG: hypothetical protein A3F16_04310 [Deltaproteobacteria bacterium RIFCSPHIGHO2_12_FULL_43_9]|nr:MAG: hypothetical protein A3F16_04310 [Deltaproteobacteria bacterium RIFCSPHIGHO2_12_FULL_43_9]
MKINIKFLFFLLSLPVFLAGCFELEPKRQQDPMVTKEDFQTIWRLSSIEINGVRNGEKASRSFSGTTFQDSNGNFGYARIEFRENGRYIANLHIDVASTGPIEETVEGDSFFSNGSMYINAPSKSDWDRLVFKINAENELFVEIKNYDKTIGGPFDNFYNHYSEARDSLRLSFVEYNNE